MEDQGIYHVKSLNNALRPEKHEPKTRGLKHE
jgi:hypothetical protein